MAQDKNQSSDREQVSMLAKMAPYGDSSKDKSKARTFAGKRRDN